MYAIRYFVGAKRGLWLTGNERFPSESAAKIAALEQEAEERRFDLTPIIRNVVELPA